MFGQLVCRGIGLLFGQCVRMGLVGNLVSVCVCGIGLGFGHCVGGVGLMCSVSWDWFMAGVWSVIVADWVGVWIVHVVRHGLMFGRRYVYV